MHMNDETSDCWLNDVSTVISQDTEFMYKTTLSALQLTRLLDIFKYKT